jgi:hypothetical protein
MGHVDLKEIKPSRKGTFSSGDMIFDDIGQIFRFEIFNFLPPARSGKLQKLHNLKTDLHFPIHLTDGLDQLG